MDIHDQIEDLEANIDELTDALSPILSVPLSTTASTLPLLDKAKFYVLLCYTIESLLYSALQASGQTDTKKHPIFAELARLKEYFQKLKDAEHGPAQPKTRLDKGAAARFIKHGLAGNDRYDQERAEKLAKRTHTRFEDKQKHGNKAEKAVHLKREVENGPEDEPMESSSGNEELYGNGNNATETTSTPSSQNQSKKNKRHTKSTSEPSDPDTKMASPVPAPKNQEEEDNAGEFTPYITKSQKKHDRRAAKDATRTAEQLAEKQARRAERREKKQQKRLEQARENEANEESILPERSEGAGVGKGHSEMFNQLLEGTVESGRSRENKGKGRSRREKGV